MTKTMTKYHMWTKEEIKKFVQIWDSKTLDELVEEMGLTRSQLISMAYYIRKAGYKLPRKRKNGYLLSLIKEALNIN